MKIVKAEDVQMNVDANAPSIDPIKVAELHEKFEAKRVEIDEKKYAILLDEAQTDFFFNQFYVDVDWKGYECYAVSETYNRLSILITDSKLDGKTEVEIIEAVFHFLKNYEGKGFKYASVFKTICDQFAIPMQEINQDRQDIRDISLDLTAAEQGIEVEDLIKSIQAQQQQPQ